MGRRSRDKLVPLPPGDDRRRSRAESLALDFVDFARGQRTFFRRDFRFRRTNCGKRQIMYQNLIVKMSLNESFCNIL